MQQGVVLLGQLCTLCGCWEGPLASLGLEFLIHTMGIW